ncbi:transporter [Aureivirga sp. CE67]|uniref:transporter n=1 Tax=Aureivirga sp. CE67 TaxID=1788983 RepID=UPI0018CA6002|nr:transporter [Aureivirga sp. CE67]
MKKVLLGLALSFSAFIANAQEQEKPDLVTDRPDQTESATVVPVGAVQWETGFQYEKLSSDFDETENTKFNTSLLRFGLLENFELRLIWNIEESKMTSKNLPFANTVNMDSKSSGFAPMGFGFKYTIAEEKGWRPKIGFLSHMYFPFTASKELKPEGTAMDTRLAFEHTLSDKFSLGYNFGTNWATGENLQYAYTASLSYSILDRLSVFGEVYGVLEENGHPDHLFDAGFLFLITDVFQWDISGGSGINSDQDYFISTGFTVRLFK